MQAIDEICEEKGLKKIPKKEIFFYLDDEKIQEQGIFNVKFIQKLKCDFYSGRKELALKLWYMIVFQLWYEKWMK